MQQWLGVRGAAAATAMGFFRVRLLAFPLVGVALLRELVLRRSARCATE